VQLEVSLVAERELPRPPVTSLYTWKPRIHFHQPFKLL